MRSVTGKTCTKCDVWKPLNEFNVNRATNDGRTYKCKECEIEYSKQWRGRNPERVKENSSRWYKENPELQQELNKKWRVDYPEKTKEMYGQAPKQWSQMRLIKR